MSLLEQINGDLKTALKARDKVKTGTIRFLLADIKNRVIASKKDLDDGQVIDVITSQIKKAKESIEEFSKGNREDLVKKIEEEIKILQQYLPPQLSKEELTKIISDVVVKVNASSPKDMGKVMGALIPLVKGKADNRLVSEIVKERLK
ncbi:MAG: GatB/YqeY domain-containing protein [bacterium]